MKRFIFWAMVVLAALILFGITSMKVDAQVNTDVQSNVQYSMSRLPEITPMVTVSPSIVPVDSLSDRVLPPVGKNAGLIVGASVLVLIIIGGVLGSRRRVKH
jgi:hypothetical protein